MENDDPDLQLQPPSPERVAARAIVLAAVACRGLIEKDAAEARAEQLRERVCDWLRELGIMDEFEEQERRILGTPLGSLDKKATIDASWKSEGMIVLGWALGRLELPAYDVDCEPSDSANVLGFLEDRASTPLAEPRLRPVSDIEHWSDTYLTLHWRLRQFSLDSRAMDFKTYVESCTWGPLTVSELQLQDGDLAIGGVRVDRVSEEIFRRALSIAQERHQAFNWLLGEQPVYSQVTTDT